MSEIDPSADAALAIKALTSLSNPTSTTPPHDRQRPPPTPHATDPPETATYQQPYPPPRHAGQVTPGTSIPPPATVAAQQVLQQQQQQQQSKLSNENSALPSSQSHAHSSPPPHSPVSKPPATPPSSSSSLYTLNGPNSAYKTALPRRSESPHHATSSTPPLTSSSPPSSTSANLQKQSVLLTSHKKLNSKKTVTFGKALASQDAAASAQEFPEPEIYAIDAGIIRCICGYEEDDGFTIQCEKCNAWQHAVCVNIDNDKVPDVYLCDLCGKLSYDADVARRYQERRLAAAAAHSALVKLHEEERMKRRNGDRKRGTADDNSDVEGEDGQVQKRRRSREDGKRGEKGSSAGASPGGSSSRSSPAPSGGSATSSVPAPRRGKGKRLTVPNSTARDDGYLEIEPDRKFTIDQMYNSYYVQISQNRFATPQIRQYIEGLASDTPDDSARYTLKEYESIEHPEVSVKLTSDHPKQKFSGFSRFGLFLEDSVSRDKFIHDFVGEVMTKTHYKSNAINQYRRFGCPKPGVLFHPSLPICIDARLVGSQARFIRRSCTPNCKVSTVIIDSTRVLFAVFSTEAIDVSTEITLPWEWDEKHPVRKLFDNVPVEKLSKEERTFLVESENTLSQRGAECACNLGNDCLLSKMKRANGAPLRNTRINKARRAATDANNDSFEPSATGGVVFGTEAADKASFYSIREARKLQSAMELIDRISRAENKKHEAKKPSKEDEEAEKDSKRKSLDPSAATAAPLVEQKTVFDTRTIYMSARMQPRKKALHHYLQAKQAYLENRQKTPSAQPLDSHVSAGLRSSASSSSLKSLSIGIPSRVPSGSKSVMNGTSSTPNVSVPSSPHLPHNDSFPVSRIPSKPPTPVPGSPLTTPVATPTLETPSFVPATVSEKVTTGPATMGPAKTVKKLSFADYKKKKTSTSAASAQPIQQQQK